LFVKAEEKLSKELDIEYFTTTMRKVHMLLASTMDDSERFLSNYQQYNSLKLSDDDSSSDNSDFEGYSDKHFKRVPRINAKINKKEQHSELIYKFMVITV
jgi:hypothetical protein